MMWILTANAYIAKTKYRTKIHQLNSTNILAGFIRKVANYQKRPWCTCQEMSISDFAIKAEGRRSKTSRMWWKMTTKISEDLAAIKESIADLKGSQLLIIIILKKTLLNLKLKQTLKFGSQGWKYIKKSQNLNYHP